MPDSVQELTSTLLTAVDSEGNVQNMPVVLDVVSALEKTNVTAEDLKVTRLGRVINLIRRKVAEVDKQLSKRLKKLVKQWQLLLQSKVPNGITLPTSSSKDLQEKGNSHSGDPLPTSHSSIGTRPSSSSVQTTPSPIEHSNSLTLTPNDSISHLKATSSSFTSHQESSSSVETIASSRTNSRGLPSRTPTPTLPPSSNSTCSTRPTQPNPAQNRFKMLQKLSSVKRSPSKPIPLVHNKQYSAPSDPPPNLSNQHDSVEPQSSSLLKAQTSFQSAYSSSSNDGTGSVSDILNVGIATPNSPWSTSGASFTELLLPGQESFNELKDHSFPLDDTWTLNGAAHDHTATDSNSRKRERSYSPPVSASQLPLDSSTPPSKKSKIVAKADRCLVSIPLVKIRLNNHHVPEELKIERHDEVQGRISPVYECYELLVKIQLGLLNRTPMNPDRSKSCDLPSPHRTNNYHTFEQPYNTLDDSHEKNLRCEPHEDLSKPGKNENSDNLTTNHAPHFNQKLVPLGARPGVDGCMGTDGFWYEWTEHISSHGEGVTIFPYVYIDGSDVTQ